MLRKLSLLFVIALVLMISSIAGAQDDVLRIGLMTDESGALTIYGYELEYGFKLGLLYSAGIDPSEYESVDAALADVTLGGRPVEVLVRDNAGDPDTATSQARELIEQQGVEILVGAPSSGVTVALQQVALDYDVLLFAAPGASPAITGANFNVNTFRACRNTYQDFLAFVPFARENLGTDFVLFAADYEFGRSSALAAEAVLGAAGINFVRDTIYAPLEATDFTTYLQQVLDSGADAVLPIWAGDTTVTLFQQIDELGVRDRMAIVAAFNSNDIVAFSDPSNIGNISWIVYHYTLPQTEINDWLVEKHIEAYEDVPDLFTECGFATAQTIAAGVEATSGDTLPEALTPMLEGLQFSGPRGEYYIRPGDHQALMPYYIVQLDNLDDPEFKYYTLLQEISAFDSEPPCEAGEERCAMNEEWRASVQVEAGS